MLRLLRPEVHCKGADYAPPGGKAIPEQAVVEAYGGRVAFLPLLDGVSTTGARRLADALHGQGIGLACLVVDDSRPTTTKTRASSPTASSCCAWTRNSAASFPRL